MALPDEMPGEIPTPASVARDKKEYPKLFETGDWFTGDKTGSGANGSTNDVAIARPPRGGPLLIAAYYTGSTAPPAVREAVLASVARIVAGEFARAPGGG